MDAMEIADGGEVGHDEAELATPDEISLVPVAHMDLDDGDHHDEEDKADEDEQVQNGPVVQSGDDDLQQTGDVNMDSPPSSHHSATKQQQLHPIEVVISPPRNPDSFSKIKLPPSWYVLRVIDQIDIDEDDYGYGQDTWYSVEFDDGRIDQLFRLGPGDDLGHFKHPRANNSQTHYPCRLSVSVFLNFVSVSCIAQSLVSISDSETNYELALNTVRKQLPADLPILQSQHITHTLLSLLRPINGSLALERFQQSRDANDNSIVTSYGNKRRRIIDSSDEDTMEFEQPRMGLRRSTRQKTTSRQASVDYASNHDIDDAFAKADTLLDGGDDDDDEDYQKTPQEPTTRRSTRPRNSIGKSYISFIPSSEDELANDSDDAFKPVTSDLPDFKSSQKKKKKGGKGRPKLKNTRRNGRESSIEFEPVRKSGRATKETTYIVPDIDDEYEIIEEKVSGAPKHVSVKEIFPPLPETSEFLKLHATNCETCGSDAHVGKGPLISCQGCSSSYHKICLGQRSVRDHRVTKIGSDHFVLQCRYCIGIYQKRDESAPNSAMCQSCKLTGASCSEFSSKKTPKVEERLRLENGGEDPITQVKPDLINNADTLLFRCTACKRGYHFDHLPPTTQESEIPDDLREARLEEYAMLDWRCKDCANAEHSIQTLVAWRPIDQESYTPGTTALDFSEDHKEYLVKWQKTSHFHDTWMPGAWIFGVASAPMRIAFLKREESMLPKMTFKEAVDEEWLLPDVILNLKYTRNASNSSKAKDLARISDVKEIFVKFQGLSYTEVVWDKPPSKDSGAPYAAFQAAYSDYIEGVYFPYVSDQKMAERVKQFRGLDFKRHCELHEQPDSLKRGKLMAYQLEGVNWMLFNFHQSLNIILADEMGLGKTVQVVSLITTLVHDKPNCWPFLIVVPNSTCPNWRRELKHWAPDLRVCTYHGGRAAQDLAFRHEIFPEGVKGGIKAHVVIMSYEAAVDAKSTFRSVKWQGLIVDEGQRLKNDKSLLYGALRDMKIPYRLLLTGTPLQNNKRELFNLLQFIDPALDAEELDAKYADLTKDTIHELHELIRPYFLRRTKAQVLKFLPPMAQIILPVTMTFLQEKLSKSIISKNSHLIRSIISGGRTKAGERKGLNNILMELRRVLCHPFLFSDSVEDRTVTDPAIIQHNLVEASGKLKLLNILLPKLKERGHRVLIFSQFLLSLTIIEDFLTALGLAHARIDGSLSALEKQKRIDAYNEPNSPLFAMLLSTRAGGVGINLATADTVIIYDPDFNPHQDIQALSRAHRIGQKNKVLCFQMTTKDTVEEKIMQIGRKKMALDHALIESMDVREDAGDDLESILKHGAEALFSDDARDHIVYDEAAVEKLIDRSQMESTMAGDDKSAETQFSFARVWENGHGTLVTNNDESAQNEDAPSDQNVWENILKQRQEEHEREVAAQQREYGRGARRRNQDVRYVAVGYFIEGVNDSFLTSNQPQVLGDLPLDSSDDDDFEGGKESAESDDEGSDLDSDDLGRARKGRKRTAPILHKPQTPKTPRTPSTAPPSKKRKTINTQSSSGRNGRSTPRKPASSTTTRCSGHSPSTPRIPSDRGAAAKAQRSPEKSIDRTNQAETKDDGSRTSQLDSTAKDTHVAASTNAQSSETQPVAVNANSHATESVGTADTGTSAATVANGPETSS
ncbi:hypothetical protein PFICI_13027 [Pestalotiopsis fici W106-1]|uniref:Chromatin remodeling factor mit1 n=1 Tax=Pestalotiopsis fici (strain W106-1 / CGMCC3.15140) TaxID=1229662 RepID=W3WKY0_PESFW|nr:uncharacterized protein PFICI_13027 [Pestalotiopsis fici W106-1]ETS74543.1 hypothetical protein PFICI_13027 [Pestalotiopsis fici W106-1]